MKKGFTLVEIIVVMGISALLLGVVVAGQREFSRKKTVDNEAASIISNLRQAQSQSTTGVKPKQPTPNYWYCTGSGRLDGYSVTFTSSGYTIKAICSTPSNPGREVQISTHNFTQGITVTTYPSQPILFKSVGQGTNLSSTQRVGLCAFGYGQEIVINEKGDISNREITCP